MNHPDQAQRLLGEMYADGVMGGQTAIRIGQHKELLRKSRYLTDRVFARRMRKRLKRYLGWHGRWQIEGMARAFRQQNGWST